MSFRYLFLTNLICRCFIILDQEAPEFDIANDFYLLQLQKDVAVNIYLNGKWGSFRHLPLEVNNNADFSHVYNEPATIGDLSTLTRFQGSLHPTYVPLL